MEKNLLRPNDLLLFLGEGEGRGGLKNVCLLKRMFFALCASMRVVVWVFGSFSISCLSPPFPANINLHGSLQKSTIDH